jgi:agmatinase
MILADDKLPFMIGGEHLVTLGSVMAVNNKYNDLYIVHFGAHADLRDDYLGQKMSHACVLRRCHELVGDGHIFQFGIRSGDREEFLFADGHTEMHKFSFDGLEEVVEKLKGKKVYFTLDLDVLDPSVFPGTGTPEAGGVTFEELRKAVTLVCSKLDIVGCDVNELSPVYDQSGVSTAVACKVIREMLLAMS